MKNGFTIGVIADVHFGVDHPKGGRKCGIADILLERAVRRLNGLIRPDAVLVLGDLIDDASSSDAEERLNTLRAILDKLDAPYLAIPGNHDGDSERFYRVFSRPGQFDDIGGVRFVAFVDQDEPGYNATRSESDVNRIKAARAGFDGPIVAFQHVCLFPPGREIAPYNYTNAASVVAGLKDAGVTLSVSGHHHHGGPDTAEGGVTFVTAPGLCEAPFPLLEIRLEDGRVETKRHELAMPSALGLVDNHIHTELAYCSENMTVEKTVSLAHEFGLAGVTFTEHSGQLYYDRKPYWQNAWLAGGLEAAVESSDRMDAYLTLKKQHESEFARFTLEAECDISGRLLIKPAHQSYFSKVMGTIHKLPEMTKDAPPTRRDLDAFLYFVDAMGKQGIRVLAHPMRIFDRAGWQAPAELFEPTARLLRKYNVAAEINLHTNSKPHVEFIRCCLENGVSFSFGSDSHNLSEIGDFARHIALLRDAGFDGDLSTVVLGSWQ